MHLSVEMNDPVGRERKKSLGGGSSTQKVGGGWRASLIL